MKDCVFCKIAAGEVSAHVVYEDDAFLAFLDIRPLTKGNTLVIPKDHYRWVVDVLNFGEYWEVAKKVGLAAQRAFSADWISFITLGLEVPHAHIRVVPRYPDDLHDIVIDLDKIEQFSESQMGEISKQLRQAIA